MQRLELALGPLAAGFELDADKETDITVDAVADLTDIVALRAADGQDRIQRDLGIHLDANSGRRDIFEIGDHLLQPTRVVTPVDLDEICTH